MLVKGLLGRLRAVHCRRTTHEIVGIGQSRRTESYRTHSTLTDISTGHPTAVVLLHSGVFKDSYPEYPTAASAPG